jgi:thiamine biosynthesis lipoprotein
MTAHTKKNLIYCVAALVLFGMGMSLFFINRPSKMRNYVKIRMGTFVEVVLKEANPPAADAVFEEMARLEKIFSSYKPDSDVSRISQNAGIKPVRVSGDVIEVLETALKISVATGGAFDPTIGAVTKLWDFSSTGGMNTEDGQKTVDSPIPSAQELARNLPLVDYRKITINKKASTVMLDKKGMTLNLGGVAKGYIVRKAFAKLKAFDINWAVIRAGGDMTVFYKPDKDEKIKKENNVLTVGVQHPRKKAIVVGMFELTPQDANFPTETAVSISTSGDYERFFIKDDVRYHHILDPRTGMPASKSQSVTIISNDPTLADALSTSIFVLGQEKGMALIEKTDGVEGVIIDMDGVITVSSGLADIYKAHN